MTEQRAARGRVQQHLYLVLDDWNHGCTVRKVSLPSRKRAEQPLPGALMHIRAPRGLPHYFTAFGTKIMVMHPGELDNGDILAFDVEDWNLSFVPEPIILVCPIYFHIDNKLFTLDIGRFNCLLWKPEHSEPWVRQDLPCPPFDMVDVSSYAVLPDGCIVGTNSGTAFIFDTKEYVWKPYGHWPSACTGRAHYDATLGGFVGLSKDPETLGYLYLYCCTMASTGTGDTGKALHPFPCLKLSKDKVFNKNPAEEHVSATLLHMRQGRFCLVECVSIDNGRAGKELREPGSDQMLSEPLAAEGVPQCGCFMYRLMTFSLGYDAKGDLKLNHRHVRCYRLPHEATTPFLLQDPVAFWL